MSRTEYVADDSLAKGGSPMLSVIVPVYNEASVLPEFHRRLSRVLAEIDGTAEVIYVNDGSSDKTGEYLESLIDEDPIVSVLTLSRNFGKEIAMTAGLDYCDGQAVVVIDADLQDPPELIPKMLELWRKGYDVVYAKRQKRRGETRAKRATARYFYRVMRALSAIDIPENVGDFRLLSKRAVNALRQLRERHRFMKGLFAWIGYRQTAILYKRDPRYAGESKWNYWRLWNFAIEGITSFTTAPLKVASYIGLVTSLSAFIYAVWVVFKTVVWGEPVSGYPSIMVVMLFLGGIELMTLGVIGEYLGRTFDEAKRRPLYLIDSFKSNAMGQCRARVTRPQRKACMDKGENARHV